MNLLELFINAVTKRNKKVEKELAGNRQQRREFAQERKQVVNAVIQNAKGAKKDDLTLRLRRAELAKRAQQK